MPIDGSPSAVLVLELFVETTRGGASAPELPGFAQPQSFNTLVG